MGNIGLPEINIRFTNLGTSAVIRGDKGNAVLIIKDDTDKTFSLAEYKSINDLSSIEEAKYTASNLQYIKDCLLETPAKLFVARIDEDKTLSDIFKVIKSRVPRNSWIAIAEGTNEEATELVSFIKSANSDKKRYKAVVFNTEADSDHIVNFANTEVSFYGVRDKQTGEKAVSYILGYLAGLPLTMSAIAKTLNIFSNVTEKDDLEAAVNKGEFILYSDEGEVKAARGINSLTTTGEGIGDDMKFIQIIEVLDMIYADIYETWNNSYKGRYPNTADNQALLTAAVNSYFKQLVNDSLLDKEFSNKCMIDIERQREANQIKYGEEVYSWSDDKVKNMTVGTKVFLKANIKPSMAMEDMSFNITF